MKTEHHIRNLLALSSVLISVGATCSYDKQADVLVSLCCPPITDENSGEGSVTYPRSIYLMGDINHNSSESEHKFGIDCISANYETTVHEEVIYLDRYGLSCV